MREGHDLEPLGKTTACAFPAVTFITTVRKRLRDLDDKLDNVAGKGFKVYNDVWMEIFEKDMIVYTGTVDDFSASNKKNIYIGDVKNFLRE